jgi:hypothetical protein
MGDDRFDGIVKALRVAVPALHAAEVPFLLGGSTAAWAYGGPRPLKDLDLIVRPEDAGRAQQALVAAGFRPEQPPEDWLLKAWLDDALVDLIFGPRGLEITDEVLARGREHSICALRVRVMALEDVLTSKLLALDEHQLDLADLLQIARAIREQVDWDEVRGRTQHSPYAAAFLTLLERLGITTDRASAPPPDG